MAKEIYVEFVILGNAVKATAIDPETGAPQSILAENARRKLEYVQKKK